MRVRAAEGLSVRRGGRTILAPLSLELRPGGPVAVVGPNGAGKSTLLRALAGQGPHAGRVTLDGAAPDPRRLGFLPQAAAVQAALSVLDCVLLGRRESLGWRVGRAELDGALALLDSLGIAGLAERPMDRLSGGQQQLVLLAQRLWRGPEVLILDEPTSALDLHHQIEVLDRLAAEAARPDLLVILSLHDLTLAARYAARLLLLVEGTLRADGPPAEVCSAATLGPAYRVDADILADRAARPVIVPQAPWPGPPTAGG